MKIPKGYQNHDGRLAMRVACISCAAQPGDLCYLPATGHPHATVKRTPHRKRVRAGVSAASAVDRLGAIESAD